MIRRLIGLTRHPKLVLIGTAIVFGLALVAGINVQSVLGSGGMDDPSTDSAQVAEVIDRSAPELAPNLIVLVSATGSDGVGSERAMAAGSRLTGLLRGHDDVVGVQSWFNTPLPQLISTDGQRAIISAHLTGDEFQIADTLESLYPEFTRAAGDDVSLDLAGAAVLRETIDSTVADDLKRAELIALPITFLILLWVFGGLWTSLVPMVIAGFSIVVTNAVLRGLVEVVDVSVFSLNLTTALGMGLAIDYALLMVRRYREEVATGAPRQAALETMMATAGRTVAFSGLTVAVSLSVMMLFPTYYLRSFAYAGVSVVITSMVGALVVTPALLAVLGRRVGRGRHVRPSAVQDDPLSGRWARLALWGTRHARIVAPTSVLLLAALALPFLSVNFGATDERALPAGAPVRQTAELIERDFPQADVPFATIVLPEGGDPAALAAAVQSVPGVRLAQPLTATDGTPFVLVRSDAEPSTGPAEDVVRALRAELGTAGQVGGLTASFMDTKQAIAERMPLAVGLVILAVLVLVLLLTGSLLLPVLAVITNGLSLTALFGATVLVFQDGHLSGLLGFTPTGKIEVSLPILMACIAFGLSMDYGMFLLSRVVEERESGRPCAEAMAVALQKTGGVITAAALILTTVLVATGSSQIPNTKMMGLGIALAVLMDALFVRVWVVPALLHVFGEATWWAPKALRRAHQRFGWRESPAPARPEKPALVG